MSKISSKQIIPLASIVLAAAFVYLGITKLGFWSEVNGPMPGFFPTIMGGIMIFASVIAFYQSNTEEKTQYSKEDFLVVLGAGAVIGATFIIGLIPSILVYVVAWLKIVEKESWKNSLKVLIVIGTIVISVFVLWLKVPFPKGILGELVWGWIS